MSRTKSAYIILPSLITAGLAVAVALQLLQVKGTPVLRWLDAPFQDSLFRVRNVLRRDFLGKTDVSPEVVLLGIDDYTQSKLGLYGRGDWLTRKPFRDQIPYFEKFFKPKVLAYDILFQETRSEKQTEEDWAERFDAEELKKQFSDLSDNAASGGELPAEQISKLNYLIQLQGSTDLAQAFSTLELAGTTVVIAYYFPDTPGRPWSQKAILGSDAADLSEDNGTIMPFLHDLQIPFEYVHDLPPDYLLFDNASMPTNVFLDYVKVGPISVPREHDGLVRRVPLIYGLKYSFHDPKDGKMVERKFFVPSLAFLSVLYYWGIDLKTINTDQAFVKEGRPLIEVYMGQHVIVNRPDGKVVRIPIDEYGRLFLDFVGRSKDFASLPFAMVLQQVKSDAKGAVIDKQVYDLLAKKLVMTGLTATGASDVGPCPVDTNTPFVHVHMVAASNLLTGTFIRPLEGRKGVAVLVVLWLLMLPAGICLRPLQFTYAVVGSGLVYAGMTFYLIYSHRYVLPFFGPVVFFAVSYLAVVMYHYLTEEREKKRIRSMFQTMVSSEVLTYMEDRPESFSLTGERREATMFFSDVAGFTTISESLPPDRLVDLLNRYLSPMTEIILGTQGYVDKYEGDAIMAEWGVPYPLPDHAKLACFAALEQQKKLAELRPVLKAEFGHTLNVRMGINSGIVSAGNMGSTRRMAYTVMGDAVNQAARFEPANKDYATNIMIGESTYDFASTFIEARLLDRIIVKGKTMPIQIYELVGRKGELTDEMRKVLELYNQGLILHWERKWDEAIRCFREALGMRAADGPSLALIRRVQQYQLTPPPPDWRGEYVRATKD